MGVRGLDLSDLELRQVAGFLKHIKEMSGSIRQENFLTSCYDLKKDSN